MMKNVLVTGANGFIGRAMCERLLHDGYVVQGAVRKGRADSLPEGVQAVEIDAVGAETDWSQALQDIDVVIHLAARVHRLKDRATDPFADYQEVNVNGTERLAKSALSAGAKRFVFLSTVKVNGEESLRPYRETDKPFPKDSYAISKLYAEQKLRNIATDSEMALTIIRPPLVYGPGVKANFLEMMHVIRRSLPLPLASIDNRRSFVYRANLVDAMVTCIANPAAAGQTYLVSDGRDVSTPELLRMLAAALGVTPKLFPCPELLLFIAGKLSGKGQAVDRLMGSLVVDISKIKRDLDWQPPFSMEEGIRKTAEWYLNEKNK